MHEADEFQGMGKKLPYEAPVGFFDGISERTLAAAKRRSLARTRRLFIWRSVAVAASLAAVVFLGFLIQDEETTKKELALEQKAFESPENNETERPILEQPVLTEVEKPKPEEEAPAVVLNDEDMNDVLAELTDEELMELAAMYQADAFIDEAIQNN